MELNFFPRILDLIPNVKDDFQRPSEISFFFFFSPNSVPPKEQELPYHKLDNSTSVRPEIPGMSKSVYFLPKCGDVEISVTCRAELQYL